MGTWLLYIPSSWRSVWRRLECGPWFVRWPPPSYCGAVVSVDTSMFPGPRTRDPCSPSYTKINAFYLTFLLIETVYLIFK